jgi:outer membrane protein TolC
MRKLLCILGCLLTPSLTAADDAILRLGLSERIDLALDRNQNRRMSEYGVNIAQAQLNQVNCSFWPQLEVTSALTRMDDDPTFIFPEETSQYTISDFLPTPIKTTVTVPDKHVKLLNKLDFRSFLDVNLPLYTGGKRRGLRQQATAGVAAAQQAVRRTDLEIIRDVTRY